MCVHALLSEDTELREYGTALLYNIAAKEVKTVVCISLCISICICICIPALLAINITAPAIRDASTRVPSKRCSSIVSRRSSAKI